MAGCSSHLANACPCSPAACLALACSPLLTVAAQPRPAAFRFWTDETLWSQGRPAVELVEEALQAAGGSRTGGPPRRPGVSSSSSASTSGSSRWAPGGRCTGRVGAAARVV
ncbi:hypothetical protein V8C86DRAFT_132603 [Haematococcus lacustris]